MGSSYSNIPKTTNVDNETLEINQNQELQIKDNSIREYLLYNSSTSEYLRDKVINWSETGITKINIYINLFDGNVDEIRFNGISTTDYNYVNKEIAGSTNKSTGQTLFKISTIAQYQGFGGYGEVTSIVSNGEIKFFSKILDNDDIEFTSGKLVNNNITSINSVFISGTSPYAKIKIVGYKEQFNNL